MQIITIIMNAVNKKRQKLRIFQHKKISDIIKTSKYKEKKIMNKARRKELSKVVSELNIIKDKDALYDCINTLESIRDDEQDYYDNIPENLQYSQRAEDSEAAIENMEEALDLLNELYEADGFDKDSELIEEAIEKIEDAQW